MISLTETASDDVDDTAMSGRGDDSDDDEEYGAWKTIIADESQPAILVKLGGDGHRRADTMIAALTHLREQTD